jgi:predicted nucleic acid-binding protein
MILVDTSGWIDHLRRADTELSRELTHDRILSHPFVIGEIALGSLRQRDIVLGALRGLPTATLASDDEVQILIDRESLHGLGIGYVDAHLLTSVRLMPGSRLWTRDKRLHAVASKLGLVD